MSGSPGTYDSAEASHRALHAIQQELERHPIVIAVRGFPTGEFTQLVAHMEPSRWGTNHETATLTVRWFAGETTDARPEFAFHYSICQGQVLAQLRPPETLSRHLVNLCQQASGGTIRNL